MSPQRFNRILLQVVAMFIFFSAVAYTSLGSSTVASPAHKELYPKLEDTELVWETVLRKAMLALVRR